MLLIVLLLSTISGKPEQSAATTGAMDRTAGYATAVGYSAGQCSFWTGDVGLDANQFRDDLKNRFVPKKRVVVFHDALVPRRCIDEARKAAVAAGFKDVWTRLGNADLGPPQ